jgi:hypothetical protein
MKGEVPHNGQWSNATATTTSKAVDGEETAKAKKLRHEVRL